MTEQQREAFEKWAESEGLNTVWGHTGYLLADTAAAWKAWQVAPSHAEGEVQPYGYLREVDGRVQLSVGPDRPADRAGGYATPWAPIFDRPAPQVAGLTETAIKSSPAYRALHREKEHLLGLLKDQAPQVAVPEGYALVPEDMLTHFRDFHDAVKTLSKTADPDGYWEHQCEVCKRIESQLAAAPTNKHEESQ